MSVKNDTSIVGDSLEKESIDRVSSSAGPRDEKSETLGYTAEVLKDGGRLPLPLKWKVVIVVLTCLSSFGNHWSNSIIVAMKTTIIKNFDINNSAFATLVAVTNLVNTFLCVALGFLIDKHGGPLLSVILAGFHLSGALVMAGASTNSLDSYPLLIVGKVLAAIGDGSLDNAQHRIFSTYFAPGRGFAFSIGAIWCIANLAQFTGQSTANIIATNLHTFAWALWISAVIGLFSLLCALAVFFLDRYLRVKYQIVDWTTGRRHEGPRAAAGRFKLSALTQLPLTFWIVVLFAVFENAGVQSFVSISTQFVQQRLKKGAVVGGWVSSMYLLLPAGLTPFLGIFIDVYGHRVSFLFMSGLTFLASMLLLRFSHSLPAFVAAYIFYALSQSVTPAPQVEIVRNIIPDPQYFATAFAIKKSVVQGSIVIITTAAGKLQDDSPSNSLDPAVTLWLIYAFASVVLSGSLLFLSYTPFGQTMLPAARLSQVRPLGLKGEIDRLFAKRQSKTIGAETEYLTEAEKENILKSPKERRGVVIRWVYPVLSLGIILIGWVMFGMGVFWGVHGSVIAGTTGE